MKVVSICPNYPPYCSQPSAPSKNPAADPPTILVKPSSHSATPSDLVNFPVWRLGNRVGVAPQSPYSSLLRVISIAWTPNRSWKLHVDPVLLNIVGDLYGVRSGLLTLSRSLCEIGNKDDYIGIDERLSIYDVWQSLTTFETLTNCFSTSPEYHSLKFRPFLIGALASPPYLHQSVWTC